MANEPHSITNDAEIEQQQFTRDQCGREPLHEMPNPIGVVA